MSSSTAAVADGREKILEVVVDKVVMVNYRVALSMVELALKKFMGKCRMVTTARNVPRVSRKLPGWVGMKERCKR